MKLFQALFRRKHLPNGHIYRGKQRLVDPVTISDMNQLRNSFAIEEKNMFLLRHPYLTPEQTMGHTKSLNKAQQNYLEIQRKKVFKDNVTMESRLGHLRYKEPWD